MIGHLSGTVKSIRKNYLILTTDSNVGYKVFIPPPVSLGTDVGKPLELYTHTYVREDQLTLYGFPTVKELEFFELLLTVSGIGPKMAMSVMATADLDVIRSGIATGDVSVFTKVSGIGKKTAERLIVDLKEKVSPKGEEDKKELEKLSRENADVLDALLALGYSRQEAQSAISSLPKDVTDSDDRVKQALRALAKQ